MTFNVLILCLASTVAVLAKPQSDGNYRTCTTPNSQNGLCVALASCASLYQLVQKVPLIPEDRTFVRESQCDYNQQPYVCCPDAYTST